MKQLTLLLLIFSLFTIMAAEEILIDYSPFNVELVSSDSERTVIEYSFGRFNRLPVEINGETYYHINLENEPTVLREGEPELPCINRSIIIPNDALNEIRIISTEFSDFEMSIAPSKGLIYRNQNPDDIPYTFSDVYQTDDFYPDILAELGEPYILRDFRGQLVSVNPFQYNPVTGVLRVYNSITLEITRIGVDTRNILTGQRDSYTGEFGTIYENRFLNFSTLRYTPLEEQGRMIVIAYDAFIDAMMPYVNWKNQKGIPTDIYPISEIGNNSGSIMNFIQTEYDLDDGLVFVQLVGDAAQVAPNSYSSYASDPAYSLLAGNDPYGDIFVGRFSAETVAQVENQVEKTIHYERDINITDTWLSSAMGVASDEGAGIGHGGLSDIQHMNLIRDNLLNYTYDTVDQIYAPSATASDVTNAINAGRGFANYTGHGSATSWGTTGFSNTHVNNLTNDYMLPFIVSVACVNGNFASFTCFAEAWLRATNNSTGAPTGAVVFYGSTRNQLWQPPMSAQQEITQLLVNEQKNTIGGLYYNGSFQMIDDYPSTNEGPAEFLCWHIFGDASLQVRSRPPQTLTVDYNSSIPLGVSSLQVSTDIPEALVSLTTGDYVILASGYTDSSGMIILNMNNPPEEPTDLNLTVTAFNRVTHLGIVEIIPAEGPFVILDSYSLSGNQPETPQYNETIDISLTLANVGLDQADNVSALLSTTSDGVTIIDNQAAFGDIAASGSATVNNAFQIETADDLENQTNLEFSLLITSGTDSWTVDFNISINAPELEIVDLIIQDPTPGGNNNGMLDPGETASMVFTVQNAGLAASPAGTASLNVNDPLVSIPEPLINIASIPAGDSGNVTFQVSIDPDMPIGSIVQFTADLTTGNYSVVDVRAVTVGIVIIEIGEGTDTNSTTEAAPINIWYRSLRGQMVYTADEINAAGYNGQGLIGEIGFYVTQTPAYSLPNFLVRMKHTTATDASSHDNGPFETVYSVTQYTPEAGDWDMLPLDEPFHWNGIDNILIDTAFAPVTNYDQSGQQRIFASSNGFRYVRSDSSDLTNTNTTTTTDYKPQIKIVFGGTTSSNPFPPPADLVAVAGNQVVYLNWQAPTQRMLSALDRGNNIHTRDTIDELERNLTGIKIYRDDEYLTSVDPGVTSYSDTDVINGVTYSYYVTALYADIESEPSNTVVAIPNAYTMIWEEDFNPPNQGWTLDSNWSFQDGYLRLYWSPTTAPYDLSALSPGIYLPDGVGDMTVTQLYNDYSASNEVLEIILIQSGEETVLWSYSCSNGSFPSGDLIIPLNSCGDQIVQLKFRSFGASTYNLNWWNIYNIAIDGVTGDPYYEVSVNPEQASESGYSGAIVEYLMTVTNTGNIIDNYYLSVSENEWDVSFWEPETQRIADYQDVSVLDSGDGIVSMQNTPPLFRSEITETGNITGGSSKNIIVRVSIPSGATGSDTATVTVTSQHESEVSGSMALETISLGNDPSMPVEPRYIAEWEPMQGVLIRYPLGIPYSLISAMSEATMVYTIVSSSNLNTAMNNYQSNNVNMDNCEFIIADTNTYWTRDYGPWSMATAEVIGVVDFDYNRPRPDDNQIPSVISDYFSIPYYEMPLTHTGGNMMGDGQGIGASTTLVNNENLPLTPADVDQHMENYLGITSYHKIPDPTGDSLQHIDTWAKFLDVDKVMVRSVPPSHSQYAQIEAAAAYFADQTSSYGTPYQVFRIYTPGNEPYTNSLIVNDRVYIPMQGTSNDAAAIISYQEAMPGYEIVGFEGNWYNNDALHCRVMGLADQGMLYVNHIPSQINYSGEAIPIEAEIKAYSAQPLISDELLVYWRISEEDPYDEADLLPQGNDIYIAHIPPQSLGETLYYYISVADESGRTVRRPFMGGEDPFIIEINEQGMGLETPDIVGISIEDGFVYITWEAVPGATGYIVEAATELGGEFMPDLSGTLNHDGDTVIWQSPVTDDIKLYRVIATLEYPALRQQSPEQIRSDFRE